LVGLAVGGDEEPLGLPALTPAGLAQPRRPQVVAQPGQLTSTPGHADSACPQPSLHPGQPSLQPLQTTLLLEALGLAGVAPAVASSLAHWQRQSPLHAGDGSLQSELLVAHMSFAISNGPAGAKFCQKECTVC